MQALTPESLRSRFNINVVGEGSTTVLLVHGFGCNQMMWVPLAEQLEDHCRLVMMDLMGCGLADSTVYDATRYANLDGYVSDVLEVASAFHGEGKLLLMGHSVGAAICLSASLKASSLVDAQVLIAPSPCFLNDGEYLGGFEHEHIETIIQAMHDNRQIWAEDFASLVVGQTSQSPFAQNFVESFCTTHEPAALQFARLTFLVDQRPDLERVVTPTLLLQSLHDPLAPVSVGEHMRSKIAGSVLKLIDNIGHSPHLTATDQCTQAILDFMTNQRQSGLLCD